ncbi:MAG TPA: SDR family oxidoreductase [Acetobacteraceae bacterium]|jgi:3-oxoacyl-[acyl-carrier protein] reductase|nr:SDR family oxidoreductase [Acetobacteraceae bacterium]
MMELQGRVALVTGAGQGIGRVFAHAFAAAGAIPIVADRNVPKARAVAEAIGGEAIEVDVGDPGSVQAMADSVEARHGRIDILVNNAAIFSTLTMKNFDQIPLDEWDQVLRVNLTGPFLCARAVLPAMRRAQWGRIVNIGSGAVTLGRPGYVHYIASKAALVGMGRSMARELGPDGITVNAILPGATFTEIERKTVTPDFVQRIVAQQCVHRPQVPEDLVGALLFLCSPGAAFVTGQALTVDGGATHP